MDISAEEKHAILEILENIVHAKDMNHCVSYITALKQCSSQYVIDYFTKNWEPILDEWVKGLQRLSQNFDQATNNRVENFNGKLKSVIKKYPAMTQFLKETIIVINHHEEERDQRAINSIVKRPTEYPETIDLCSYLNLLIPFAYKEIKQQVEAMAKVTIAREETATHTVCRNIFLIWLW